MHFINGHKRCLSLFQHHQTCFWHSCKAIFNVDKIKPGREEKNFIHRAGDREQYSLLNNKKRSSSEKNHPPIFSLIQYCGKYYRMKYSFWLRIKKKLTVQLKRNAAGDCFCKIRIGRNACENCFVITSQQTRDDQFVADNALWSDAPTFIK